MALKIILAALCANLLYTNANLMMAASSGNLATWQTVLMVVFATTYSLISTLSIFKMQSIFAIACFALLDGTAVYLHFADHGANFKWIVAAYFGIYTAYTLIVCFVIKMHGNDGKDAAKIEGHDAAYWYKCFLYQKSRAEGASSNGYNLKRVENAEPTTEHLRKDTKIEGEPKELPDIRKEINNDKVILDAVSEYEFDFNNQILSIKRAFARMKDPDKRRERIKDMPFEVQAEIRKLYDL